MKEALLPPRGMLRSYGPLGAAAAAFLLMAATVPAAERDHQAYAGSVEVESGGVHERLPLGELFVANLPYYSFGLRVAPHAVPHDGAIDFVWLPPAPRRALPAIVRSLRSGTHLTRPGVRTWKAAEATLTAHGSPVIADTVDVGPGPVSLVAARDALVLVVP